MKIIYLKCNDIIESLSVHNYKKCKCGACSIDGGNEYTRISGDFKYIHWVYDDVDLGQVFRHIFLRIFINYFSIAGE